MDFEWAEAAERFAERLGWSDAVVITSDEVADQSPQGPPLVVLATRGLTVMQAQSVGALVAVGRDVALLSRGAIDPAVASWIPAGVVSYVGAGDPGGHPREMSTPTDSPVEGLLSETVLRIVDRLEQLNHIDKSGWTQDDLDDDEGGDDESLPFWMTCLGGVFTEFSRHLTSPHALHAMFRVRPHYRLFLHPYFPVDAMDRRSVPDMVASFADGGDSGFGVYDHHDRFIQATTEKLRIVIREEIKGTGSVLLREGLGSHPQTSPEDLRLLADAVPSAEVERLLCKLAWNYRTPDDILGRLALHPSAVVREGVAGNVGTREADLSRLTSDPNDHVRLVASRHPRLAGRSALSLVLAGLATQEHALMRCEVAGHSETPAAVLVRLASDEVDIVTRAVARNPHTPPELLSLLAGEPIALTTADQTSPYDARLRQLQAEQSARLPGALGTWRQADLLRDVARNPSANPETLRAIAGHGCCVELIENPNVTPEILEEAFTTGLDVNVLHRGGRVRERMTTAIRAALTEMELIELAGSPHLRLRLAAACHRNATTTVLRRAADGIEGDAVTP